MEFETWKPVVGYDGWYEVSNIGRVRSVTRKIPNAGANGGFMTRQGQIMKTQIMKGYRKINLRAMGAVNKCTVHRLVCEAFHGPSNGLWALHRDGDSLNNLADNLYWGTPAENQEDAVRHGTHAEARCTHCPRGHSYSGGNVYTDRKNKRRCRVCNARQTAERRARG